MKIINGHCGLGGNRGLWGDEHEITGVELESKIAKVYQDNFINDEVIIDDVMQYFKANRNRFDAAWFSPPCQKHSRMMKATRHDVADYFDPTLWQLIVFCQHFFKGLWVVENVKPYYEPLIKPTAIIGRHYFWSNFPISENFKEPKFKDFITAGTSKETEKLKEWLGIKYEGNIYYKGNHCPGQVLRNCVHPELGLHVFNEMMKYKNSIAKDQTLF